MPTSVARRVSTTRRNSSAVLITLLALLIIPCRLVHSSVELGNLAPPPNGHAPGHCVMYGQCGAVDRGIFAKPLNCLTNSTAVKPESKHQELLLEVCGSDFRDTDVCCSESQLETLQSSVQLAYNLIYACPACWNNFVRFFCEFTCSPNQATFLNVTSTAISKTKKVVVTSVDHYVSPEFGEGLFNSCKDVKFPSDNVFVMDLLGGGAKNYHEMFTFMGQKRTGGSPFQIDYPLVDPIAGGLSPMNPPARSCNDTGIESRCTCVDCTDVCPVLDPTPDEIKRHLCRIGPYSCVSIVLSVVYASIVVAIALHTYFQSRKRSNDQGYDPLMESPLLANDEREANGDMESDSWATTPNPDTPQGHINVAIEKFFYKLGYICARYPIRTLAIGITVVLLCSLGWLRFHVETDPARLWVGPNSAAAREKHYFDTQFGPFYRTQQLIVTADASVPSGSPVLSRESIRQLFHIENVISELVAPAPYNVSLGDLCFRPTEGACVVQSLTGYWAGDVDRFEEDDWKDHVATCAKQPSVGSCIPEFQQPIKSDLVLGGFEGEDFTNAAAMIVTYVINNSNDKEKVEIANAWEKTLLKFMGGIHQDERFKLTGLKIDYMTENSIELELSRVSTADIPTIALSYVVMFLYASLALGSPFSARSLRNLLVGTKFTVGLCGVLIVAAAVASAVGLCSLAGVKATLIIAEVIPFLVLAVGVDNVFILQNEFDRRMALRAAKEEDDIVPRDSEGEWDDDRQIVQTPRRRFLREGENLGSGERLFGGDTIAECAAEALGRMGPSVLLAAVTETLAFSLGAFVDMPAVSAFAVYAATAIWLDFLLQVTCFVAAMSLDARRELDNRVDCLWCIRLPHAPRLFQEGVLQSVVRDFYAKAILYKPAKPAIILFFLGLLTFLGNKATNVELGLDQTIALPRDSYLVPYFKSLDSYFRVGPPLYFVMQATDKDNNESVETYAFNATSRAGQQALCGRFSSCKVRSVGTLIEQERKRSQVSYIAQPAAVWIDDFFYWLNPSVEACCRFKKKDRGLPIPQRRRCGPFEDCDPCIEPERWNTTMEGFPEGGEFLDYMSHWLDTIPDEDCPLAGKAAYATAVVPDRDRASIRTSHVRTYHTPLRTQADYISALASARRVAADLSQTTGSIVFPYSVFYIFFEQYAGIWSLTIRLLASALAAVLGVTTLLLGSFRVGAIVTGVVAAILVDLLGVMAIWNVSLNAVSLVNLAIGAGIGVEFCCHVARAFVVSTRKNADMRAQTALVEVGSSVFSGITLTKFAGILVLATAKSRIFEVYYFRVYLSIVLLGATHGLILLPVLLSLLGADKSKNDGQENEEDQNGEHGIGYYQEEGRPTALDEENGLVEEDVSSQHFSA